MGCGLRKEIEGAMSLLPGKEKYRLRMFRWPDGRARYAIIPRDRGDVYPVYAQGFGKTKAEALADLLSKWTAGDRSCFPCPVGSREELRLRLALAAEGGRT